MKAVSFTHVIRPPQDLASHLSGGHLLLAEKMMRIMNSSKFRTLRTLYQYGRCGSEVIEGIMISYEENEDNPCNNKRPALTNMAGPLVGFHLFCDAWKSRRELIVTVAHELHRIHFSGIRSHSRLAAGDPWRETREAEAYSLKIAELFN